MRHLSIGNHRFSGAILRSYCIFNRKFQKLMGLLLQFAVLGDEPPQVDP